MTTELLRPVYSNISYTGGQCAFSGAVMSTELEVSIEKKKIKCFEKTTIILFNLFVREKGKYSISQYKGSILCLLKTGSHTFWQ